MISIIVPVYNMEKYLCQCVDSLLNQSYKDIEIILVDDGSVDSSVLICDEYAKKNERIKVIHKKNGGQGSARNCGLDVAKGNYISFIDSDDWVDKNMYCDLLSAIESEKADLAICNTAHFYENGETILRKKIKNKMVMTKNEAFKRRFDSSEIVSDSPCNKLYKSSLFENLRYPENRLLEDSALMYLILDRVDKVVAINTVGYNIRCASDSVSRRKYNIRRCDTIITYTEMANFFSSKNEYKEFVASAVSHIVGAILYNAGEMQTLEKKERKHAHIIIKKYAKELLASKKKISFKGKVLLRLIVIAPNLYGFIYRKVKKV